MASPAFEAGRPGPAAVELARLVERALKGSGAADTEALCVLAGRKVRGLRSMGDDPGPDLRPDSWRCAIEAAGASMGTWDQLGTDKLN